MSFPCIHCQSPIEPHFKACPSCGEPLSEFVRTSLAAPIDGKYQILSRLGRGGMGEVYKVLHLHLNTVRVIKLMRPNIAGDPSANERFIREARLATKVQHPNVATLHDFSSLSDGSFYMVWEFIEGKDLTHVIAERKRLSPRAAASIAIQALYGLEAIHRAGIVHRDLSPDNIMLSHDEAGQEVAKIIDLGIAKSFGDPAEQQTQTGIFIGKWRYCSPEQLGLLPEGEKIDGRADIYSFGILMYEMITGEPPFIADGPQQYYAQHARQTPRPMRVLNPVIANAPQLEALIFKALEKDRSRRFASAREFAEALQRILPELPDTDLAFDASETLALNRPTVPSAAVATQTIRQSEPVPAPSPRLAADDTPTVLTPVGARLPERPAAETIETRGGRAPFAETPLAGTPFAGAAEPPSRRRTSTVIMAAVVTIVVFGAAIGALLLRKSGTTTVGETTQSAAVAAPLPVYETGTPLPAATSLDVVSPPPEKAAPANVEPEKPAVEAAPKPAPRAPEPRPAKQPAVIHIPFDDEIIVDKVEVEVDSTPQRQSRFGRRGGAGTLSASPEIRLPAFRRGIIDDYDVMTKGGDVQWAWVAPGMRLSKHRIELGKARNLTSYDSAALRKILEHDFQSELNDVTEGAKESLTAEMAIYWAEPSRAVKRGIGVELILRDSKRQIVAMMRHQERESSPEAAAQEVVEAVVAFVEDH